MACLIISSVSPSEGTLWDLCLAVTSLAAVISLYVDFYVRFPRYMGALERNLCFAKKGDRGCWFLIFSSLGTRFCQGLLEPRLLLPEALRTSGLRWSTTST